MAAAAAGSVDNSSVMSNFDYPVQYGRDIALSYLDNNPTVDPVTQLLAGNHSSQIALKRELRQKAMLRKLIADSKKPGSKITKKQISRAIHRFISSIKDISAYENRPSPALEQLAQFEINKEAFPNGTKFDSFEDFMQIHDWYGEHTKVRIVSVFANQTDSFEVVDTIQQHIINVTNNDTRVSFVKILMKDRLGQVSLHVYRVTINTDYI